MKKKGLLEIKNIKASIDEALILKGISLSVEMGTIHAILGPNGSGKSTFAQLLSGSSFVEHKEGNVFLDNKDLMTMEACERFREGLFVAFQYPVEIPGLMVGQFLRRIVQIAMEARGETFVAKDFLHQLREAFDVIGLDRNFVNRYLNAGFSGGEKKKMEMLQMLLIRPYFIILDEIDSGLDIDALKSVSQVISFAQEQWNAGFIIITHYKRILEHLNVHQIHIMQQGLITHTGDHKLLNQLEKEGYKNLLQTKEDE